MKARVNSAATVRERLSQGRRIGVSAVTARSRSRHCCSSGHGRRLALTFDGTIKLGSGRETQDFFAP
jgi:hypothetical protein